MLRLVASGHVQRIDRTSDQHASGDDDHQGKRNLHGDEHVLDSAAAYCGGTPSGRGGKSGARALQSWSRAEKEACQDGYSEGVEKNLQVGSDIENGRAEIGRERASGESCREPKQ